ncbi:DUF962 domain-containing protein [Aquabacterium sp. CECT 9606]|uniref:Mpo1 family 2-hydroxy fatty acid dioxygenase n=1 Tax=Aquabacterium sp. CECT 9606 TaxID=2845822 RepID=UPI001E59D1CD|nr:Mpo1-like protein [Aquabacterium sp. CECT 9606]CAH0356160.1 hypothetical protein AQB9606_04591 [Aquabacterium sp. CECT 9606]
MNKLTDLLAQYASYHRDHRNILTHVVGIPMIVLSLMILLARPTLTTVAGVPVNPGMVIAAVLALYYLKLDLRMGAVMAAVFALGLDVALQTAPLDTGAWLAWGLGLFLVGWGIQFLGHYFEGRKPAFVDDIIGLIIGPLFVLAEVAFLLGLRKDVEAAIEQKAGSIR